MSPDVAILGAGIAGSALAIALARAGRSVVLLERDTFPRDKLCGEFLSTEVRGELAALGVEPRALERRPAEITHARFISRSGRAVTFELGGTALGLSRLELDALLAEEAKNAGADLRTGVEARAIDANTGRIETSAGALDAPLIIAAYGRRTRLDKTLSRTFTRARHPYAAIKRHYRPRDASDLRGVVELHAFDGGYCGFCFIEGGVVNACALIETARADVKSFANASRTLAQRFAGLEEIAGTEQAVAEIPFALKETALANPRVLFLGDAAGMIAPLAGDGQAMALSSARILSRILLEGAPRPNDQEAAAIAHRWDRAWKREFGVRMRLGSALQSILLRPAPAEVMLFVLDRVPALAPRLVRLTRG